MVTETIAEKQVFGSSAEAADEDAFAKGEAIVDESALGNEETFRDEACEGRKTSHNIELGRRGEEAAARFLEKRGFEILERNWTCSAGEADIIAQDDLSLIHISEPTRH